MLGDKIGDASGKVTSRRVLPNPGGGPKMETSFEASGKLLGVEVAEVGTFWSIARPDGTLFGEGNGIVMGRAGEAATWTGHGIGTLKPDGGVSYRGAIYYQAQAPAWSRLSAVASLFEFDVDAAGHSRAQLWEWK